MRSLDHLFETIYLSEKSVVGFVAGLNFPQQGQRSESVGWLGERAAVGRSAAASLGRGRKRVREKEEDRKTRRRQSDIRDGTQTLVYPVWLSLFLSMPPIYPSLPVYTHLDTHLRGRIARKVKSCRAVPCHFCAPPKPPSLYYPVTREAYKPNKCIDGGRILRPSNLHLFRFLRYLSFCTRCFMNCSSFFLTFIAQPVQRSFTARWTLLRTPSDIALHSGIDTATR